MVRVRFRVRVRVRVSPDLLFAISLSSIAVSPNSLWLGLGLGFALTLTLAPALTLALALRLTLTLTLTSFSMIAIFLPCAAPVRWETRASSLGIADASRLPGHKHCGHRHGLAAQRGQKGSPRLRSCPQQSPTATFLPRVGAEDVVEQRRLARAQEAGENSHGDAQVLLRLHVHGCHVARKRSLGRPSGWSSQESARGS